MRETLTAPFRKIRSALYKRRLQSLPPVPGSVAMLHTGRVGSTVVAKMLKQHPRLFWDGELYEKYRNENTPERHVVDDFLAVLRWRMRNTHGRTYCFETKSHRLQHLKPIGLDTNTYIGRLRAMGFSRFIVLRRKNYLRQAVSAGVGRADKRRHIQKGEKAKVVQIELDLEHTILSSGTIPLLQRFEEFDQLYDDFDRLLADMDVLRLTYEDDIEQNPLVAYEKVCHFLGIPVEPASVSLRKTNPYPLSDILLNYEEVATLLRGTEYEWMLEEE